ncbi:peptidase M23 [Bryobacterales bacterium F-183]|nr:peptidase M23 [Bryobacterales bacterium F-183]
MLRRRWITTAASLLAGAVRAGAALKAPVVVRVPCPPTPFAGSDGHVHLCYEIHLTNFEQNTGALEVVRVEVAGDSDGSTLATYTEAALEERLVHPGVRPVPADPKSIPGGMTAVLLVWVTLRAGHRVPRSLRHRIELRDKDGAALLVDGAAVEVGLLRKPLVLGPLFRDHAWIAHEGPGNPRSHHWRSLLAVNGRVTVPQRFAIDFIGLDDRAKAVPGEPEKSKNTDWTGYGTDVLAATGGIVRSRNDGVADNVPMAPLVRVTELTMPSLYGNHVVLETANRQFLHYAHLQASSVRVQVGQRVRQGDVIGRVGNSGNTNAAHLHFHVADSASFEESESLPFVFQAFESFGVTRIDRVFGRDAEVPMRNPLMVRNVLPLDGAVLRFPK